MVATWPGDEPLNVEAYHNRAVIYERVVDPTRGQLRTVDRRDGAP
jgi:hypothetical protein